MQGGRQCARQVARAEQAWLVCVRVACLRPVQRIVLVCLGLTCAVCVRAMLTAGVSVSARVCVNWKAERAVLWPTVGMTYSVTLGNASAPIHILP